MLAAIAEGSDRYTQQKLFQLLNLSEDQCIRQQYYRIATSRVFPVQNVTILNNRKLLVDEDLSLNPSWLDFVTRNSMLGVFPVSIKNQPLRTACAIRQSIAAYDISLNFNGNSVLLDTTDYNGLWTTAFADAAVELSPFYNQEGEVIGTVTLMRVRRRARMGYVKSINAKVLELPIGPNCEYKMLFMHLLHKTNITIAVNEIKNDIISEMIGSLRQSNVPIEVAIPQGRISGKLDMREVLENLGATSLWTNPEATK